mgnify:CR=1 FL=1
MMWQKNGREKVCLLIFLNTFVCKFDLTFKKLMELTGKIIAVLPERSGVSARAGSEWKMASYVLETMEQYPVKPGTVVHLPRLNETTAPKKTVQKRQKSAEEQLSATKKLLGWMALLLLIAVGLLTGAMLQLVQML